MPNAWLCPDCRWAFPKSEIYPGVRCVFCPRCNGTNLAPEDVVRRRQAEARIEALRAALQTYGMHDSTCGWFWATPRTCTCGLDEAVSQASGDYSVTRTPESAGTE